jgi:uncharacterized protein YndB with AHSA1/START domain
MATIDDPVTSTTFHLLTDACPERVWSALTCPRQTTRYFHGMSLRSSWQPDAEVDFRLPGQPTPTGQVLCVRIRERLGYTVEDLASGTATYVVWTIRPVATGCVVRLDVHDALATTDRKLTNEELEDAWLPVIEGLRTVLTADDQSPIG